MYPEWPLKPQRGAGLPIAIFIITALALIVTSMAQQQESSGASISRQILSQRAFYAAESGAQAAVTQALHGGGCASIPAQVPAATTFQQAGLKGCKAIITSPGCPNPVQADIDGDSTPETVFTLVSEGKCGSGAEEASRTVEVRVR